MFEKYNEKARRTIFFARYEASLFGSPSIETEHLLLGLLREDKALTHRLLPSHTAVEQIRKEIERATVPREQTSTSVDLPLSNEGKRVLAYASEESERLGHKMIGTEHLLLGLLREERCFAAQLLNSVGVTLKVVREDLGKHGPALSQSSPAATHRTIYPIPTVKVASLAASAAFYANLGLRSIEPQPTGKLLVVGETPFVLVLFDQSLGPSLLCFAVNDLPHTISQLQQSGAPFEQILGTHSNGAQTALLRDPDGNLVCLLSIM